MNNEIILPVDSTTRRNFLKTSGAAALGVGLASQLGVARQAHAADNSDTIRIALVGCGGRGTRAVIDNMLSSESTKLVAMADAFPERIKSSYREFERHPDLMAKIDVPQERQFVGFDAYKNAIATDCDMVILATPPGFRPAHFEAAVNAGKHVFMEKPVATDVPGVRKVLAAGELAKKKGLGVGVGLQRRHHEGYVETIKRLQDGAIGDIVSARVYWNGDSPWCNRRSELLKVYPDMTEMEYQLRNWYFFVWLCGDNIVEQHIHNMDVINWLKNDYPVRANGMGGCQVRRGPDYGETFDHHFVEFEYADGTRMHSQCRHQPGVWGNVSEHVQGTKGIADISGHRIRVNDGEKGESWNFPRGRRPKEYEQEHADLVASIRAGKPINEAEHGAKSTMTAILGRMCTYSGQSISWEDAMKNDLDYSPETLSLDATPKSLPGPDGLYALPIPGITKFV